MQLNIRPWRSWITQQIPILKIGGSNPFGRAKEKARFGVLFSMKSPLAGLMKTLR